MGTPSANLLRRGLTATNLNSVYRILTEKSTANATCHHLSIPWKDDPANYVLRRGKNAIAIELTP